MNKLSGKLALLFGIGALGCAAAGLFAGRAEIASAAELENGPVKVTCKNAFDKEVTITVEYKDGTYYLADFLRNIYVFDMTNFKDSMDYYSDMHTYLHQTNYPKRDCEVFSSSTGKFEDKMAVSVFENLVATYDYYSEDNIGFDWHNVNGKDDNIRNNGYNSKTEFPLYAFVHFNVDDDNYRYNASFFRPAQSNPNFLPNIIFIGDGGENYNFSSLKNQGRALDVIAHEYQHGVTDFLYGKTLVYEGESGALNECFSDMIALFVQAKQTKLTPKDDKFWYIGEDAMSDAAKSHGDKCMRDITNPTYPQAGSYTGRYQCQKNHAKHDNDPYCDYNGVHYNSTVLSHLQYLICKRSNEFTVDKMGPLWLESIRNMPSSPAFIDFLETYMNELIAQDFSDEAQKIAIDEIEKSGFGKFHKVTFLSEDGEVLKESYVRDNGKATAPKLEEKEAEEGYRFEFDGWSESLENVTEDLVVKPSYSKHRFYTVKFLDASGKLLKEEDVDEGEPAKGPAVTPTKQKTAELRFEFEKWSEDVSSVTKDMEVSPIFKEIKYYIVKFVDAKGNIIGKEQEIDEGMSATPPETNPQKAQEQGKKFTFKGWSESYENVTKSMTISPVYDEINVYTVKFVDENGNVLKTQEVDEGQSVTAPQAPTKESTEQYDYTFKGWSEEFDEVEGDLTITPVFEEEVRKYHLEYFLEDKLFTSTYANYGSKLDGTPKGYDGWYTDKECTKPFTGTVTGELTLYAKKTGAGLGLIIGLSAGGAVLIAGAVVAVILIKKKKHA